MRHVVLLLLLGTALLGGGDASATTRKHLERFATSLVKEGFSAEARVCLEVYAELGASEKETARLTARVDKAKAREPRSKAAERHAKRAGELATMVAGLADEGDGAAAKQLARLALRLDSECDGANQTLQHTRHEEAGWVSPRTAALFERRRAIAEATGRAGELTIELETPPAADPALLAVLGGNASAVRHEGLTIESHWAQARLETFMRQLLRAMAVSNWLCGNEVAPLHKRGLVLHVPYERLGELRRIAAESGRADERAGVPTEKVTFAYVKMPNPGADVYRSYAVAATGGGGDLGGTLLILYDDTLPGWGWNTWYEADPQLPFWLVVGHFNYLAECLLGTSVPEFNQLTDEKGTQSARVQHRIRLGNAGLVGCRAWLRELAREDAAPLLSSCMLNQIGKIGGERRLKALSAAEYLHEGERFGSFLTAYREHCQRELGGTEKSRLAVERAEVALAESMPAFEAGWKTWLLGQDETSVAGMLVARADSASADPVPGRVLAQLNELRAAAGLEPVALGKELSQGAALHAHYLAQNPDQATSWPEAHEQLADRDEFSAAGAWAGSHSVIAFNGPEKCLDDWIETFYHRLPLTHPGLVQIGFGHEGAICVLDAGSVVNPRGHWVSAYPYDGQREVPLRFRPELPNPVPEREDQATLGYPITLQLGASWRVHEVEFTLTKDAEEVPCFLSSPDAPSNPRVAPNGAWCLMPKAPLEPRSEYRVEALWEGGERKWGFRTAR